MLKKIIALISAAIIVLNAFVMGAFRAEAAFTPAAAPVVEEIIEALLVAMGVGSSDTVGQMSFDGKINSLDSYLQSSDKSVKMNF